MTRVGYVPALVTTVHQVTSSLVVNWAIATPLKLLVFLAAAAACVQSGAGSTGIPVAQNAPNQCSNHRSSQLQVYSVAATIGDPAAVSHGTLPIAVGRPQQQHVPWIHNDSASIRQEGEPTPSVNGSAGASQLVGALRFVRCEAVSQSLTWLRSRPSLASPLSPQAGSQFNHGSMCTQYSPVDSWEHSTCDASAVADSIVARHSNLCVQPGACTSSLSTDAAGRTVAMSTDALPLCPSKHGHRPLIYRLTAYLLAAREALHGLHHELRERWYHRIGGAVDMAHHASVTATVRNDIACAHMELPTYDNTTATRSDMSQWSPHSSNRVHRPLTCHWTACCFASSATLQLRKPYHRCRSPRDTWAAQSKRTMAIRFRRPSWGNLSASPVVSCHRICGAVSTAHTATSDGTAHMHTELRMNGTFAPSGLTAHVVAPCTPYGLDTPYMWFDAQRYTWSGPPSLLNVRRCAHNGLSLCNGAYHSHMRPLAPSCGIEINPATSNFPFHHRCFQTTQLLNHRCSPATVSFMAASIHSGIWPAYFSAATTRRHVYICARVAAGAVTILAIIVFASWLQLISKPVNRSIHHRVTSGGIRSALVMLLLAVNPHMAVAHVHTTAHYAFASALLSGQSAEAGLQLSAHGRITPWRPHSLSCKISIRQHLTHFCHNTAGWHLLSTAARTSSQSFPMAL